MGRLRIDRIAGPPAPLTGGGRVVAARCHVAASPAARLIGLLGTPDLRPDEAVWFPRCRGVHALGLRAPIGVALLDDRGRVLRVVDPLPRGRAVWARDAAAVVECRTGVLRDLAPGDVLQRHEIPATSASRVPPGGRYP
jgi:uncharacterized membrane protein (UPF0127 family)